MKIVMKKLYVISALLAVMSVLATDSLGQSRGARKNRKQPSVNILEVARKNRELSIFVEAVKAADLEEILNGSGPFTVFAPSNAAFDSLPEGATRDLMQPENKDKLKEILLNHVVKGKYNSKSLENGKTFEAAGGQEMGISALGGKIMAGGVEVSKPDITANNGVIHIVNRVIVPPAEGTDANK
jgi:uncharacterized surface protein with fasciclin (FAS1) repeats